MNSVKKKTEFRMDVWLSRDILVVIAKWLVLNVLFPDEKNLDMLVCVSKFFRDLISTDLRISLRRSKEFLDSISATLCCMFYLNPIQMGFNQTGYYLCEACEYVNTYHEWKYKECKMLFDARNGFQLSLQAGFNAIILEFSNDVERRRQKILPFNHKNYKRIDVTERHLSRKMFHGDILLMIHEKSNMIKRSVLFMSIQTGNDSDDMNLAMTALGMCVGEDENGFYFDHAEYPDNLYTARSTFEK